jgi:hypothetical protein
VHALDFDTDVFRHWLAKHTGEDAELTLEPIAGGGAGELHHLRHL